MLYNTESTGHSELRKFSVMNFYKYNLVRCQHSSQYTSNYKQYKYLDGFTIPLASSSILTAFFLDGKSLRTPRSPYLPHRKISCKRYTSNPETIKYWGAQKFKERRNTSIEFTAELRRVGSALLPINAFPSIDKSSYLISTFGILIPTLYQPK